ncbi:hypothetical protein JTB14_004432 [Gonioctena quinquepunctata]|nr:hypothetical protein JTB14_004432 [Gonioctena quinquepunctata]
MPEDSTKFVAETLPSSSELTLLGSDVSIDNPFRLLLSGNEADGETLLDSSHLADSKNHKDDSNIQEVAETLLRSSEPKFWKIADTAWQPGFKSGRRGDTAAQLTSDEGRG